MKNIDQLTKKNSESPSGDRDVIPTTFNRKGYKI